MRESLIFYRSFYEAIKTLPPENQAKIYDAIFSYSLDFQEPELEGIDNAIFTLIKPQLDANIRKYENGKKGAEHGKKGGRPKKKKENTDNLNTKETPKKPLKNPKRTPNVNDNVNDNVNKKDNEKENTQKSESDLTLDELQIEIEEKENTPPAKLSFYTNKAYNIILEKEAVRGSNKDKVKKFVLIQQNKKENELDECKFLAQNIANYYLYKKKSGQISSNFLKLLDLQESPFITDNWIQKVKSYNPPTKTR